MFIAIPGENQLINQVDRLDSSSSSSTDIHPRVSIIPVDNQLFFAVSSENQLINQFDQLDPNGSIDINPRVSIKPVDNQLIIAIPIPIIS